MQDLIDYIKFKCPHLEIIALEALDEDPDNLEDILYEWFQDFMKELAKRKPHT